MFPPLLKGELLCAEFNHAMHMPFLRNISFALCMRSLLVQVFMALSVWKGGIKADLAALLEPERVVREYVGPLHAKAFQKACYGTDVGLGIRNARDQGRPWKDYLVVPGSCFKQPLKVFQDRLIRQAAVSTVFFRVKEFDIKIDRIEIGQDLLFECIKVEQAAGLQ